MELLTWMLLAYLLGSIVGDVLVEAHDWWESR